jgi:hypothetical protein
VHTIGIHKDVRTIVVDTCERRDGRKAPARF